MTPKYKRLADILRLEILKRTDEGGLYQADTVQSKKGKLQAEAVSGQGGLLPTKAAQGKGRQFPTEAVSGIERQLPTEAVSGKRNQLPTEAALCERFQVSRQTVRQALLILEEEGLIERRQGSGAYITQRVLTPAVFSDRIAILAPCTDSGAQAHALWELQSILMAAGWQSRVFSTENRFGREREILQTLLSDPVRAVISAGVRTALPNPNLDLYQRLQEAGALLLAVGQHRLPGNIPCVCSDDYSGGRLLAERLISLGHKKIGGIFPNGDLAGGQRLFGCLCCLRDHDIPFDDRRFLLYDGYHRGTPSESRLRSFLQTISADCTALICHSEETAQQLLGELYHLHIPVPQQMSVIAFTETENNAATGGRTRLTAAVHPGPAPWTLAAHGLLGLLDGKSFAPKPLSWVLARGNTDAAPL